MNDGRPIRVLLVDDHLLVRVGLAGVLARTLRCEVVAEAATGAEAVKQFLTHHPDLTLLDRRLPDFPGEQVVACLRQADPDARVIMLSIDEGEDDVHHALQAGAMGYLPKSVSRAELLAAIEAVLAGQVYVAEGLRERLGRRQQRPDLTHRELEVLRHIVEGRSNRAIASELGISEVTVKIHVGRVLQKLDVEDRTQAATTAIERGIVHLERPDLRLSPAAPDRSRVSASPATASAAGLAADVRRPLRRADGKVILLDN